MLKAMKTGENQYNKWAFYACTNRTAGCPYTWFVNYNVDSEIISKYNMVSSIKGEDDNAINVIN